MRAKSICNSFQLDSPLFQAGRKMQTTEHAEHTEIKPFRVFWVFRGVAAIFVGSLVLLAAVCFSFAQKNPTADLPFAPAPAFSLPSGVYTNNLFVRITTTSPGSVIRFTTDGSDP